MSYVAANDQDLITFDNIRPDGRPAAVTRTAVTLAAGTNPCVAMVIHSQTPLSLYIFRGLILVSLVAFCNQHYAIALSLSEHTLEKNGLNTTSVWNILLSMAVVVKECLRLLKRSSA